MKIHVAVFALVACSLAVSAYCGTVTGRISAHGKQEVKEDIVSGKYDSRKYKFVERIDYEALTDFVVYVDQSVPGSYSAPAKPVQVVIQKNATFSPHVLPILVGTTVEWPNNDDIYHNVFSMSEAKPFDLGLYKNKEIKRLTFDKPGRVDVFCSIHTRMGCVVLVMANPFFSTSDNKGNYRIADIPAGTYRITAWHERMPSLTKTITVPQSGEVSLNFEMGITGLPQY